MVSNNLDRDCGDVHTHFLFAVTFFQCFLIFSYLRCCDIARAVAILYLVVTMSLRADAIQLYFTLDLLSPFSFVDLLTAFL